MSDTPTDNERSLVGRAAAHASWARTADRTARTAAARAALDEKFLREADGDPIRARHLRKSHFALLALKSARSRRKAASLLTDAAAADREGLLEATDGASGATS